MPRYRYVGDDVRDFPTIGVYDVSPGDEFDTDRPVSSTLIVTVDGEPTHVDSAGEPVSTGQSNADPDPEAGVVAGGPAAYSDLYADAEPVEVKPLTERTHGELLALAADLEIHGRSRMTKDELLAALEEAARADDQTDDDTAGGADEPQE